MKKFHIKKGDLVFVNSGKDKGKTGVVLAMLLDSDRAVVEGVNIVTKNVKPSAKNPQRGIVKKEAPIHVSNLNLVDPVKSTSEKPVPTRIGKKLVDGKFVRFAKKSGEVLK